MKSFHDFLRDRIATGGFSNEDALASFLPLLREVIETHGAGCVAPLKGLDELRVESNRIWFEQAKRLALRSSAAELHRVESAHLAAVEVIAEARRTTELDEDQEQVVQLAIADSQSEINRPVYLPGYVSWEHQLGHHDPLTDVLSLGMILASLVCGLDFSRPNDLEEFLTHRQNLFTIVPNLHPVLAQAIVRMTEIDRHRRAQDLSALLHNLENYRDQEIDFDLDLARVEGFREKDSRSKQHVVLTKLKERLFEISRRNPAAPLSPDDANGQLDTGIGPTVVRHRINPAGPDPRLER